MSIYGNMILFFPEQRVSLTAYTMTPMVNGGYTRDQNSDIVFTGIFQNSGGRQIKDSNGNLVKSSRMELWTEQGSLDGKFITWESQVFRLNTSNDWIREGGFFRYGLEKVVGNNGTELDNASWNLGSNSFS